MKNAKFSGHFTVDGSKTDGLERDEYIVSAATKLGSGDMWVLTSRIRYGTVDLTVPVPVMVRWAGDTPVICLDDVGIPGLGTFSARIVIDRGKYAGTWTHGDKGGHMFGSLLPADNDPPPSSAPPKTAPPNTTPR